MNTFKWYIVWVTYQEGNRWLRSRCTMQNVGLTKNTLIKNTHALIFISLKFEWVTLFCSLISPLWFHKLIVLQSLTYDFELWLATGFVRDICYMLSCLLKLTLLLVQISLRQIYRYVILIYYYTQQTQLCSVSVLGTSSLIGSQNNVIRSSNDMFHIRHSHA